MALQLVNMNGVLKPLMEHLAFNKELQRQMNFFPCDNEGKPIPQPTEEEVKVKKKDVVHVESDTIKDYVIEPTVIVPEGVEIFNPLDEEKEVAHESAPEPEQAPKKRGRKPNQPK